MKKFWIIIVILALAAGGLWLCSDWHMQSDDQSEEVPEVAQGIDTVPMLVTHIQQCAKLYTTEWRFCATTIVFRRRKMTKNWAKSSTRAEMCGVLSLLMHLWSSYIMDSGLLNLKMLREHPEAVRILSSMKLIRDCRVPLFKQRFTRFICRLVLKRLK